MELCINIKFRLYVDSDVDSDSPDADAAQEPPVVLGRRRRYVRRRRDRAINSHAAAMDPANYDPFPPSRIDVRQVSNMQDKLNSSPYFRIFSVNMWMKCYFIFSVRDP
jgi:hypothetical protein